MKPSVIPLETRKFLLIEMIVRCMSETLIYDIEELLMRRAAEAISEDAETT